jgi:hypothetical protein
LKTSLTYGFLIALSTFLLSLIMFITGMHSDPAHLGLAQLVGSLGGLAFGILFLVLGIRAQRSAVPAGEGFGYGRAFGAGFGIQVWASVFSVLTNYLYSSVINPHFKEVVAQAQAAKMQAQGMTSDQIEKAQSVMHFFMSPVAQAIATFFATLFFGTIVALIVAAFLKRTAERDPNAI